MEHNQSHSRESIKITHNRVKRSRLFLNAFMRTLRRANAISAPRKSATREFCKWRTEEHPRETKKNFERETMMNKERERENAERNKKEKEGETLGVLSLFFFFLPVVSFFANTRDDREQSRTFYVSPHSCCCFGVIWYVVVVVVVVFHVAREKKVMTTKNFFYSSFFNFFSVSLLIAISLRGSVARIYESKKNTNNNRLL